MVHNILYFKEILERKTQFLKGSKNGQRKAREDENLGLLIFL